MALLNIIDLDLYDPDDFFIPLSFVVSDFRDLGKSKGSFSKTIKIPSTKRNDALLSYSFDISAEGFFDRNKKIESIIKRDNVETFRGTLQLKKVIIQDREFVEYELNLLGNNAAWLDSLKNASIQDLDYEDRFLAANLIVDSWQGDGDTAEVVFPLIDYGLFKNLNQTNNIGVELIYPAVFLKPIFIKMFQNAGYKITGDFFKTEGIKDLIMPFTEDCVVTTPEYNTGQFCEVAKAFKTIANIGATDRIDFDPPAISDEGNNFLFDTFQPQRRSYIAPNEGSYSAVFTADYQMAPVPFSKGTFEAGIQFGNATSLSTERTKISFDIDAGSDSGTISVAIDGKDLLKNNIIAAFAGNIVDLSAPGVAVVTFVVLSNMNLKVTAGRLCANDGNPYNPAQNLEDITQIDLLNALIQKFNLKLSTNVLTREVSMEVHDKFLNPPGDAVDFTDKRDTSQEQRIEQIEEGLARELNFKYKEENDDVNLDKFKLDFDKEYGQRIVTLDNEFLKDTKEIESPVFAPSFMLKSFQGSLYMPVYDNGEGEETDWTPKLLIWDGLKLGSWKFAGTNLTTYPFAYSIKENSDINDITLLYDNLQGSIGNIDRFYKNKIRQFNIGRLRVTHYYLTEEDIAELNERDLIFDDGVLYELNRINDYLDGMNESTEVETLQIV